MTFPHPPTPQGSLLVFCVQNSLHRSHQIWGLHRTESGSNVGLRHVNILRVTGGGGAQGQESLAEAGGGGIWEGRAVPGQPPSHRRLLEPFFFFRAPLLGGGGAGGGRELISKAECGRHQGRGTEICRVSATWRRLFAGNRPAPSPPGYSAPTRVSPASRDGRAGRSRGSGQVAQAAGSPRVRLPCHSAAREVPSAPASRPLLRAARPPTVVSALSFLASAGAGAGDGALAALPRPGAARPGAGSVGDAGRLEPAVFQRLGAGWGRVARSQPPTDTRRRSPRWAPEAGKRLALTLPRRDARLGTAGADNREDWPEQEGGMGREARRLRTGTRGGGRRMGTGTRSVPSLTQDGGTTGAARIWEMKVNSKACSHCAVSQPALLLRSPRALLGTLRIQY